MKIIMFLMAGMSVTTILKPLVEAPAVWRHFRAYPDLAEGERLAKLGLWRQAKQHFINASLRDPADFKAQTNQLYADLALRNWLAIKKQTSVLIKMLPAHNNEWYLYRAMASYALGEKAAAHQDAQHSNLSEPRTAAPNHARILLALLEKPRAETNQIISNMLARQVSESEPQSKALPSIKWGPLMHFTEDSKGFAVADETVALPVLAALEKAPEPIMHSVHQTAPDSAPESYAALGYQALARGDQQAALDAFSKAPRTAQIIAQLAYIEQSLGHSQAAKKDFEDAVALSSDNSQRSIWQSQLAPLAKRFSVSSQIFVRLKSVDTRLAGAQTTLGLSGNYAQASVRLNGNPDRPLSAIATFASSLNAKTLRADPASAQAGFGLSWKPFANINAHIDALRLLRVGKASRKDWELRVGAGMGDGYGPADGDTTWLHWQATSDIALIGLKKRDVFAAANGRVGMGWAFKDQWALTPYLGLNATVQASGGTATQVEFSPGIWLHHSTKSGLAGADVRLEYRHKLAGNAANANGAAITAAVNF